MKRNGVVDQGSNYFSHPLSGFVLRSSLPKDMFVCVLGTLALDLESDHRDDHDQHGEYQRGDEVDG